MYYPLQLRLSSDASFTPQTRCNLVFPHLTQSSLSTSGNLRMCVPSPSRPLFGIHLPPSSLGNSRLPALTQTNLVNIYLFHADSGSEVLRVTNQTNPFGRAGSIAKQVNDSWFPNGGVNYNGTPISYPFYW